MDEQPAGTRFDPRIEVMVEGFRKSQERPFVTPDVHAIRQRFAGAGQDRQVEAGVKVQDIEADGVPVRLYRPAGPEPLPQPLPLHVYYHGGGFMFGSAMGGSLDGILSRRAKAAHCLVASVEYRLAPEHPFPAGVEDSYAALAGLVAAADQHRIAANAVSVGGVSSGGNFAAVVALMARDRDGPPLILQLLEIAGTDLTKSSYAWRNPRPGHDTTRARDLAMVDMYLPDLVSRAHPYASPLLAPDLGRLPPAYVMNAQFDPRRDECEAYVARLNDAGVPAIARTLLGHVHGSMSLHDWPPAAQWQAEANDVLAKATAAALAGQPVSF